MEDGDREWVCNSNSIGDLKTDQIVYAHILRAEVERRETFLKTRPQSEFTAHCVTVFLFPYGFKNTAITMNSTEEKYEHC